MANYLLGIDIGTQGTKTVLFDLELNPVASAFEASNLITPKPGTVWQEADDIFLSCTNTIKEVMEKSAIAPGDLLAIGIDAQMAGIMGIDKDGEAVTYYDSWLDSRCQAYMEQMRGLAGKRITEITGGPVTYTHGPKILWWKGEEPAAYKSIDKFVLPSGYVVGKMAGLTGGEAYFDYTCLQYSGFGDNKNKVWSDELLDAFGVEKSKMARIVSPFDVVGKTTRDFAARCGLVEGIPIVAGGGDTACSIFGSGLLEPNTLLDCAGTASVMCSLVDDYVPDTQFETMTMMRSPVDGLWMPLAYINGGGLCLRWFRDEFGGGLSYIQLEELAGAVEAGSEGAVFIPHFSGRVLPNNPYVKGSFIGLDWKHTKGHLFKSIMEGIAYEYRFYLSVMQKLYPSSDFQKMYATGGGANSDAFNQIKSDVLGLEVVPLVMSDTALVGSAVIAGVGAKVFADYKAPIQKSLKTRNSLHPNGVNHIAYEKYAAAYLETIEALTGVYANIK